MPVSGHRRPGHHAVDDRVIGLIGRDGSRRDHSESDRRGLAALTGDGDRTRRCVMAEHDRLDAPVEHVGQRARSGRERAARVVGWECQFEQQIGQRVGGIRVDPGRAPCRRAEHDLTGPRADVTEDVQPLGYRT